MKTTKIVLFFVSIALLNPAVDTLQDISNLFTAHVIFLMPILVDMYPQLDSQVGRWHKVFINVLWGIGIIILIINIIGAAGGITVQSGFMIRTTDYVVNLGLEIQIQEYLMFASVVYTVLFFKVLLFEVATPSSENRDTFSLEGGR